MKITLTAGLIVAVALLVVGVVVASVVASMRCKPCKCRVITPVIRGNIDGAADQQNANDA